jgi:hypothetical protein
VGLLQPFADKAVKQTMQLRLLITSALIVTALSAQGPGAFRGRRGNDGNSPSTPPTAAQLAARELQRSATYLGLDSAQTSALTSNTALVSKLTSEQTTLQTNQATLKTDYSTLATQVIAGPAATPAELAAIQGLVNTNLQLRVTAAGEIVAALQSLTPALTAEQTAKLPGLVGMLATGGGIGGFRR